MTIPRLAPAALFEASSKAIAAREPFTVKALNRRADGAIRVLRTNAEARFGPNGEVMAWWE